MEFSLILANKIAMMLLWMVVGYIVVKAGVMRSSENKTLSSLLVYIIIPCTILHSFQIDLTEERMQGFIGAVIFSVVVQAAYIVITKLLTKPFRLTKIDRGTLIFSNCGNLIIPLTEMVLGEEYVFYVAAYVAVFNILFWTYGQVLFYGKGNISVRKMLTNPNVIAVCFGVIMMLTGFRFPAIIDGAMDGLGDMVGPTSMLVIGMVIAEKDILGAFRNLRAYPIVFIRLIVYPMISILLLYVSGAMKHWPFMIPVLQVSMLSAAAPPATLVSQMAVVLDEEPFNASSYNIVGTILCVLTIPFIIFIYQLMF